MCIILDAENIYQTFYDLLNQNYQKFGDKRICKISINADIRNVFVDKNFKFILIQEKNRLY